MTELLLLPLVYIYIYIRTQVVVLLYRPLCSGQSLLLLPLGHSSSFTSVGGRISYRIGENIIQHTQHIYTCVYVDTEQVVKLSSVYIHVCMCVVFGRNVNVN